MHYRLKVDSVYQAGKPLKGDALIHEPRADALHTYITEDWVCFGIGAFGSHMLCLGAQQK